MKAVVGLGNPGARYDATRHNVAWWLIDLLKRHWSASQFQHEDIWLRSVATLPNVGEVWLIKPLTFMNRSGLAVRSLVDEVGLDPQGDMLIVVDDTALPPGKPRFRARGSAGGHNGLTSVERALGTSDYARLRIGVGEPPRGYDRAEWVLSEFDPEAEDAVLDVLPKLAAGIALWAERGIEAAMNEYNPSPPAEAEDEESDDT